MDTYFIFPLFSKIIWKHRATLEVVKKKKYHILSVLGIEQWSIAVQPIACLLYCLCYLGWSIVCDDLCQNVYSQPAAPRVRVVVVVVVVVLLVITDILFRAGDWWQTGKEFKGTVFSFFRAGDVINIITNIQWLAFVSIHCLKIWQ